MDDMQKEAMEKSQDQEGECEGLHGGTKVQGNKRLLIQVQLSFCFEKKSIIKVC